MRRSPADVARDRYRLGNVGLNYASKIILIVRCETSGNAS